MRVAVVVVAVLLATACGSGSDPVAETSPSPSPSASTPTAAPSSEVPRYWVVGEFDKWRTDRQPSYWVAIDPPDLTNDGFKNTVKAVLRDLAKKKGDADFDAFVSEDRALAQWYFELIVQSATKSCDIGQPCARRDPDELQEIHKRDLYEQGLVADYFGGYGNSSWKYELAWYPRLPLDPSPLERTEIARRYQGDEKWRPFPDPTTPPPAPTKPLNGEFYFVKPYGQHDPRWSITSTCDPAERCTGEVRSIDEGWSAPITKSPGAPWVMDRKAADAGWDCGSGGPKAARQGLRADISYTYDSETGHGIVKWIAPPGACGSPKEVPFESRFGLKPIT